MEAILRVFYLKTSMCSFRSQGPHLRWSRCSHSVSQCISVSKSKRHGAQEPPKDHKTAMITSLPVPTRFPRDLATPAIKSP